MVRWTPRAFQLDGRCSSTLIDSGCERPAKVAVRLRVRAAALSIPTRQLQPEVDPWPSEAVMTACPSPPGDLLALMVIARFEVEICLHWTAVVFENVSGLLCRCGGSAYLHYTVTVLRKMAVRDGNAAHAAHAATQYRGSCVRLRSSQP